MNATSCNEATLEVKVRDYFADVRVRAKRSRLAAVGSLLAVAALVVTACGSPPGAADNAAAGDVTPAGVSGLPDGTPKRGGEATMVLASVGARFDPATQQIYAFTEAPVMSAVFGVLAYQEAGADQLTMGFLKSLTSSDDSKTWTAVLQPNLKFSDGTPFDAAAIQYNIERIADPTTGSIFQSIAKDLQLKVVDDVTLEMTLPQPNTQFDKIFAQSFACIGSPTAMKAEGVNFGTKPVGAGPFKIDSITPGQSISLVRNEYYESFAPGQPYLDKLNFSFIAGYPQQLQALEAGSAQLMLASGQTTVQQMQAADINVRAFQSIGGANFLFNNAKAPFSNPVAREALTLALDRNTVASTFAQGTPAATNLFPESSPYYDPQYNFPQQDKERAQQLFDQLAAEGTPLEFTLVTSSSFPDAMNAANSLQAQLAGYQNVKMTIKAEPTAQNLQDMREGNYDLTPGGIYSATPIPAAIQFFRTGGTLNYSRWSNATADAAMDNMYTTTDDAQIKKDWGVVQEQINKEFPVYFANIGAMAFGATKNITGLHVIGYGFIPLFGPVGYVGED